MSYVHDDSHQNKLSFYRPIWRLRSTTSRSESIQDKTCYRSMSSYASSAASDRTLQASGRFEDYNKDFIRGSQYGHVDPQCWTKYPYLCPKRGASAAGIRPHSPARVRMQFSPPTLARAGVQGRGPALAQPDTRYIGG